MIKRLTTLFVTILFLFLRFMSSAQSADSMGVYSIATVMPFYRGGDEALYQYINQNIQYPEDALSQRKQGKVQLKTIIDENGNVIDAKVVRGVFPSIDAEAERVIKSTSSKWESGRVNEKPVKTYKYLAVTFRIDTSIEKSDQPISFIGGNEAFISFIKKYVKMPNTILIHPEMISFVTLSVSFNSLNQINNIITLKGGYRDLNDEAIRLIKLSQGKWLRNNIKRSKEDIEIILTVPFTVDMIDSNEYKRNLSEDIITVAYKTNEIFKRGYDNYRNSDYRAALPDMAECILKRRNYAAALYIRAMCYLNLEDVASACEDLLMLKMQDGIDSEAQNLYYKYCSMRYFAPHHLGGH